MTGNHILKISIGWLLLLASVAVADPLDFTVDSLPAQNLGSYNVDISRSSVSGLSAGAYMADQFFVAFSKDMLGCGLFAGGPYGCANGNLAFATGRCMNPLPFNRIDNAVLQQLQATAVDFANQGKIDPLDNLGTKKVYVFSGRLDTTVAPEVTDWVDNWYLLAGVPPENIAYKNDMDAPHALPTLDYGNTPCTTPGNPWMNDCDYDGPGQALTHILGSLNPPRPTAELSGQFIKFFQNEFFEPGQLTAQELKNRYAMNEYGFAYVPKACQDGQTCQIHVAFHGCKQVYNRNPDASDFNPDDASNPFGLQFVKFAGYNEWADTNHLIIVYPQAQKVPFTNPRGCYDWWGYLPGTASTYATKQGPQMKAVYAMMTRIAQSAQPACPGTNQPPTIVLVGSNPIKIKPGSLLALPEPEATAQDPEDGDLTAAIVRSPAGPLDTSRAGTQQLKYNVQDSEGCKAKEAVRTVVVDDCRHWTVANADHATENRAVRKWCFGFFFFPYRCYYAVGSDDALGSGSTQTTLRKENSNTPVYKQGECP